MNNMCIYPLFIKESKKIRAIILGYFDYFISIAIVFFIDFIK